MVSLTANVNVFHKKYLRNVWQPALLFCHRIYQNVVQNPTFRLTRAAVAVKLSSCQTQLLKGALI